jgi:hypothetical protein
VDDGIVKLTVAWVLPATTVTSVGAPGTVIAEQGAPAQFSKAAFFQRTLISSRFYCAFRFISNACFSLFVFPTFGISTFEFVCAIPNKGSIKSSKIFSIIL